MLLALRAQTPEWIWHDNKGSAWRQRNRFFRKPFTVDGMVTKAVLTVASDDQATVYLNGASSRSRGWDKATTVNVTADCPARI